jgi:hypothetical protein
MSATFAGFQSEDDVNLAIRRTIRSVLGMASGTVIAANDNGPSGASLYATVLITNFTRTGRDSITYADDSTVGSSSSIQSVTGTRMVTASLQFFRSGANQKAFQLQSLMQSAAGDDACTTNNLSFINTGMIRNLSKVVDTLWEDRAGLDIELYVVVSSSNALATFDQFPFVITHQ